jgi:hypothetical protein
LLKLVAGIQGAAGDGAAEHDWFKCMLPHVSYLWC